MNYNLSAASFLTHAISNHLITNGVIRARCGETTLNVPFVSVQLHSEAEIDDDVLEKVYLRLRGQKRLRV